MIRTLAASALFLASQATAQTVDLAWQGRVNDSTGMPINGPHALQIDLWTANTGGESVFTQSFPSYSVSDGYVAVILEDIPAAQFTTDSGIPRFLWVATTVDEQLLGPRQPMNTVPYAANLIGGSAQLSGMLLLGTASDADCAGGNAEGAIIYDAVRKTPRFCNGTRWVDLGRTGLIAESGARRWSDGRSSATCQEYRNPPPGLYYEGVTGDGYYWLDTDNNDATPDVRAYCDQTTFGGGWTAVVQCLPSDGCRDGETRLYGTSWTTTDHRTAQDSASYVLGASTASITASASQFMTEIRRTSNGSHGFLIYPMHQGFFTASASRSESADVPTTFVDEDGDITTGVSRTCWSRQNATYDVRSYRGVSGRVFFGTTTGTPNTSGNTDCDYGPWPAQILVRNHRTSAEGQTTEFGRNTHVGWANSPFAHRIFVR